MLKKYQKYAPIGLFIGLIAAITALILRIAAGQITLPVQISIVVAVIGLAAFIALDPETILNFFTGRQAKHGGNALILTLAVVGILVIVNLFVYNNNTTWDLTEDRVNSLAPETLEVLENVEIPVFAQAFYSTDISTDSAGQLLSNFKRNADGLFAYEFIDPYQDPIAANQAGIDRDGTVILNAGDQSERLTTLTEEKLVNAIIKLQNPEQSAIYALTGHGEEDFFTTGDYALTELRQLMESKNYRVNQLNLIASPVIPEDTQAIFIAAPQVPLDQNEVDLIADYLANGGSVILLSEPAFLTERGDRPDPLAAYLQEEWGVTIANDLIIDLSINPAEVAIADQYGQHPITEVVQGYVTFFPTSHSISTTEVSGVTTTDLILTTSQAWAETNLEGILNNEAAFDEEDIAGPISLAVALENSTTGTRVVVIGDSDFATDSNVTAYGNLDFAIGIIDWTAENEALINLTPPQSTTRVLIPPTRATQIGIILGGLVGLPLFIAVTGIIIAIQRKRTG